MQPAVDSSCSTEPEQQDEEKTEPPPPALPAPPARPAPQPGIRFFPDDQSYQPFYPPGYNNTHHPIQSTWCQDYDVALASHNPPPSVNPPNYYPSHPNHAGSSGTSDYAQQLADSIFGPPGPNDYR